MSLVEFLINVGLALLALICLAFLTAAEQAFLAPSRSGESGRAASANGNEPFGAFQAAALAIRTFLYALVFITAYRLGGQLAPLTGPLAVFAAVLLVVLACEALPRLQAHPGPANAAHLAGRFAQLFDPLVRLLNNWVVEPLSRLLPRNTRSAAGLTPDELKALLELSTRRGVLDRTEDVFLRGVMDLNQTLVRDVMIPRVQVQAYDVNASAQGLRELMRRTRMKKVPVYSGAIDRVVGLIYAKVLFLDPFRTLRRVVMPVRFVPEIISCEQLLQHFRATRTQIAIVVDEFGGMAGLVTLEDVLEEIVGDLHDPEDRVAEPEIRALSDTEYEISGQLSIEHWPDALGIPPLPSRVATVGGMITSRIGRPAQTGDVVRIGNLELKVTRVTGRRVESLTVRLLPAAEGAVAA